MKTAISLLLILMLSLGVYAAGEVDRTFSAAVQNFPDGLVRRIVKQADGKILVGGSFTVANNSGHVAIARFNPDGTVDQTFNAPDFYAVSGPGYMIRAAAIYSMAVQTDGKILVSGNFTKVNTQPSTGFLRLNSDGSLDTTFNPALLPGTTAVSLIKIQSDNKILAFVNINGVPSVRLIRLNADGSRDTSFQELVDRVSALEIFPSGKILIGTDTSIYRLNSNGSLDISYNQATLQSSGVSKFVLLPNGQVLVGGAFRIINNITVNYIARLNADGTVDTSFNPSGTGANSAIFALDVLPDGKIVIGGPFTLFNNIARNRNARLNSDGTLDTTYNHSLGINNSATIYAVVSAGDGKVYLGGEDGGQVFPKLVRVNADGTRDTTFNVTFYQPSSVTQVLSQPDGKVIISGNFIRIYGIERRYIARLNADGTLDTGFNPSLSDGCFSIALQPDGKIFCGLRRFNPDGTADTSFQPPNNLAFFGSTSKIFIQPDGKILFGGVFSLPNNVVAHVIRLNSDGSEDTTFNKITINQFATNNNRPITGLKLQADGKIVVTGDFTRINNLNRGRIARFNADGTIDTTFFSTVGANGEISDFVIQSDGKIVIGGSFSSVNGVSSFYLARLLPDSNLDTSFVGNPNAFVYAVEKQADDKLIIGGFFSAVSGVTHQYLARLNANGSPDTFGGVGPNDIVLNINAASNGKILISGNFTRVDNFSTISVARLAGTTANAAQNKYDFDGDGRADLSVFRPSDGYWYQLRSQNNSFFALQFGSANDRIAPADYDGDGKTDIAVFRDAVPGAGNSAYFYVINSSDNSFRFAQFGATGDVPVSGDWDGDGKADLAVYRDGASTGGQSYFYYRPSSQPGADFRQIIWGATGDKPLTGDFDGDGRLDAAVFRASTAAWYILRSSNNQVVQTIFGLPTDIPVPADYDGDGQTNIAVFRPSNGTWYTSTNPQNNYGAIQFGASGDLPVPADYDGDGRADTAVFRPSNGGWYLNRTTSGFTGIQFGSNNDKPAQNAFIR